MEVSETNHVVPAIGCQHCLLYRPTVLLTQITLAEVQATVLIDEKLITDY